MSDLNDIIAARREVVFKAYGSACAENKLRYLEGDDMATPEYIFPNQIVDANNIVDKFYNCKRRVISVQKKTKVGADGLMIEIAKIITTHIDDDFVVNPSNVKIITGMSNLSWEKDMIYKAPNCFKKNIFHHGKLHAADLMNISNGIIIIDEIDTGDKELQVLHRTLKDAGILDVKHMEEHNNHFVFISATMIKELYDLYRWGELHEVYRMTIPSSYFGHKDFLDKGIIKEFYPLNTKENAEKWVQEDILDNYGNDYRIHIVRVTPKTIDVVHNACIHNGIVFTNHTSTDRIQHDELTKLFKEKQKEHIVIAVKGFFRRANLIPNRWKLRIGSTHESWTKTIDNNVQIQGLTGRMSGYWRNNIEMGHKTGPHRTSVKAVGEYENIYEDPFGKNSYQCAGFNKNKGKISAKSTMLSTKHVKNLEAVDLPVVPDEKDDIKTYRIYDDEDIVHAVCKILKYDYRPVKENNEGFKETSLNKKGCVVSLRDAVNKVPTAYGTNNGIKTWRTYYPCYVDTTDTFSLRFVVIIRPGTDENMLIECDKKYHSIS
tara:strand:+ start:166 stop:1803 length:1638 start_codon:yes stop_codon:yes gene_type:complete